MSENIEHVASNCFDEYNLSRALNQTEMMIEKKMDELLVAKQNNDEDSIHLLNAQISWYTSDMKQHHWGESRLEKIYSDFEKKQSIIQSDDVEPTKKGM